MAAAKIQRQHLHADALFRLLRQRFEQIPDHRSKKSAIPLADALMAGFAMFSLKDPSLLAFDQRRKTDANLGTVYHLDKVPSDTQMRAILDPVPPDALRPAFTDVFRQLQRGKVLERYVYLNGCYLISLDGTGYFSSTKIHCPFCLHKQHANGQVTYYHQMLGAALVHPDHSEVIPLAPEPIIQQDGSDKNDCERNAARRWLAHFRREHPHLPVIIVEDGLAANGPHLRDLIAHRCHFILVVRPGDHAKLFATVTSRIEAEEHEEWSWVDPRTGVTHHYLACRDVPLNDSHPDLLVHFVEYWQVLPGDEEPSYHNTWITDVPVIGRTVHQIGRGGRARWKVENETFNTLKNQGYQLEHNYGHGAENLSVVLALLMMLAFLVDQTQQICCALFQAARAKMGSNRRLWENLRALFYSFQLTSYRQMLEMLAYGFQRPVPVLDTS